MTCKCNCSVDPLFDRIKAAAYLDLSPGTLAVWDCTKKHDLEPIKVGSNVRYKRSSLDRYLARRQMGKLKKGKESLQTSFSQISTLIDSQKEQQ